MSDPRSARAIAHEEAFSQLLPGDRWLLRQMRFPKSLHQDDCGLAIEANAALYWNFFSRVEVRAQEIELERESARSLQLIEEQTDSWHAELRERLDAAVLAQRTRRIESIQGMCSPLGLSTDELEFLVGRFVDAELAVSASMWRLPTIEELRLALEEFRRGAA